MVEGPPPDAPVTAGGEGLSTSRASAARSVAGERCEVVGVGEEPFGRVLAQPVPGSARSEEVVLVHDDRRPTGVLDRRCAPSGEGRLAGPVDPVDGDEGGAPERDDVAGEEHANIGNEKRGGSAGLGRVPEPRWIP